MLKSGIVEKTEIIISSGIPSIDKAALEAAKKSTFNPLPFDSFLNIEYDLNLWKIFYIFDNFSHALLIVFKLPGLISP